MSSPIQNNRIADLLQTQQVTPTRPSPVSPTDPTSFNEILENRLKVSGHAQTRLSSREIQLDKAAWERVIGGVERAAQKGAKESLVLVDDVALVVSVKNKTVITAVDQAKLKDNVFTNIDSAIIV